MLSECSFPIAGGIPFHSLSFKISFGEGVATLTFSLWHFFFMVQVLQFIILFIGEEKVNTPSMDPEKLMQQTSTKIFNGEMSGYVVISEI